MNREVITTGNKYRTLIDPENRVWAKISMWKMAEDVWFDTDLSFEKKIRNEFKTLKKDIMKYLTANNKKKFQFGSITDDDGETYYGHKIYGELLEW